MSAFVLNINTASQHILRNAYIEVITNTEYTGSLSIGKPIDADLLLKYTIRKVPTAISESSKISRMKFKLCQIDTL
jgi:hypothetical protein